VRFAFGVFLILLGIALILWGIAIAVREIRDRPAGLTLDPILGKALGGGGALVALGVVCLGFGLEMVGLTESDPIDWWKATPLSPDSPAPTIPSFPTTTLP
jgi:hypothetical protein